MEFSDNKEISDTDMEISELEVWASICDLTMRNNDLSDHEKGEILHSLDPENSPVCSKIATYMENNKEVLLEHILGYLK